MQVRKRIETQMLKQRFVYKEMSLTTALYCLYMIMANRLVDTLQGDFQDPALVPAMVRDFVQKGTALFQHAQVFAAASGNTLVLIMLSQMRQCEGYNFGDGEVTSFSWKGTLASESDQQVPEFAKNALRSLQEVVSLTNSLLTEGFLKSDTIEHFYECFNVDA